MASYESVQYTSRPADVRSSEGGEITLGQVLQSVMEEYQPQAGSRRSSKSAPSLAGPREAPPEAAESREPESTSSAGPSGEQQPGPSPSGISPPGSDFGGVGSGYLVGGIQPPLETPIAWLHAHMRAPDNFLYAVIFNFVDP